MTLWAGPVEILKHDFVLGTFRGEPVRKKNLYIGNLLTFVIQSVRVQVLMGGVGGQINLCNPVIRTLGGYRKSLRTHHVVP